MRNDSTRHGLGVRAADRPVRHLRRRLPDQPYPLQEPLLGRDPVLELLRSAGTLSITVDTSRLMAPDHRSAPDLDVLDQTVTETVALDDDQKRLLAYLIGPLLRGGGTGRIRTTRELALECNETKAKVERRLAALRQRLYEQGVPGLWPDEYLDPAASLAPTVNYVERLGEYAYFHGWANLSDLPPGRPLL